jgi:hypothetical protein
MRSSFAVEQLVVVAELEQLRVGELEDLDRRLRARLGVADERAVPCDDDDVVGEVRDAMAEHLVPLLAAERAALAAQELRDGAAVRGDHRVGRRRPLDAGHREDEIVLREEFRPQPGDGGAGAIDQRPREALRIARQRRVFQAAQPERQPVGPAALDVTRERHRDDAVVEHLEPDREPVGVGHRHGGAVEGDGRLAVLHVGRRRRLRRQARRDTGAEVALNARQVYRIRHVEEEERGDVARNRLGHLRMLPVRRRFYPSGSDPSQQRYTALLPSKPDVSEAGISTGVLCRTY